MFKILLVVALLSAFADAKRSKVPKFSDIPVKDINNKTASLPASDDKCLLVVLYGRESTEDLEKVAGYPEKFSNLEVAVFPIIKPNDNDENKTKKKFAIKALKGKVFAPIRKDQARSSEVYKFLSDASFSDEIYRPTSDHGDFIKYLVKKGGIKVTEVTGELPSDINAICY